MCCAALIAPRPLAAAVCFRSCAPAHGLSSSLACFPPLPRQATRMFVSNLNQKMSQRFLVLVLLPHVRADIRKNRRLHFALFQVRRRGAGPCDCVWLGPGRYCSFTSGGMR